ncbi:hypothetical protein SCHPADRAFT_996875 [Schizopora paradoxa]|uniref:F-box domain-containing protein n=1 Tax=Schizopora paradoxa TaxID=27342 RepID=A0A0H2RR53_9AGAM|nr:hypothetical protein SCHPADRAFT_996875 [Schizopora paradoxa]
MEPQEGDGDGGLETSHISGFQKERLHPEVISVMMGIVERLRDGDGCIDALSDWFDIDELWSSKSDYRPRNGSQVEETAETTKVARRRRREDARKKMKRARDAANMFLDIGNHIFSQIQNLEECLEEEENADRISLLSLPDEILSIILQSAAASASVNEHGLFVPIKYTRTSFRLSHICQRLRTISISTQSLWSYTNSLIPTEMVETCFRRLSAPIGEVQMTYSYWNGGHFGRPLQAALIKTCKSYLSAAIPFSQYWRRFNHRNDIFTIDGLRELAVLTRGLNAPHLSDLSVSYSSKTLRIPNKQRSQEDYDALHYFSTWSTPSLSTLRIENFIPKASMVSNLQFVKKLHMSLCFGTTFFTRDLVSLLETLSHLEELSIHLEFLNSKIPVEEYPAGTKVVLSSIQTLKLDFFRCSGDSVSTALAPLSFPNVTFLKLCAWGLEEWQEDEVIDEVIRAVITDAPSFPKLERFELGIGLTVDGQHDMIVQHLDGPICVVRIPFTSLRHICHLILVGVVCVFADIPDPSSLPALHSLTLKDCTMLDREWVLQLLPKLFERGLQPSESQLTVEDCEWTIPAEELQFSEEDDTDSGTEEDEEEILEYCAVTAEEMLSLVCSAT